MLDVGTSSDYNLLLRDSHVIPEDLLVTGLQCSYVFRHTADFSVLNAHLLVLIQDDRSLYVCCFVWLVCTLFSVATGETLVVC